MKITDDHRNALRAAGWEFYVDGYWRITVGSGQCIVGGEEPNGTHRWSVWGVGRVIHGEAGSMVDAARAAVQAAKQRQMEVIG